MATIIWRYPEVSWVIWDGCPWYSSDFTIQTAMVFLRSTNFQNKHKPFLHKAVAIEGYLFWKAKARPSRRIDPSSLLHFRSQNPGACGGLMVNGGVTQDSSCTWENPIAAMRSFRLSYINPLKGRQTIIQIVIDVYNPFTAVRNDQSTDSFGSETISLLYCTMWGPLGISWFIITKINHTYPSYKPT